MLVAVRSAKLLVRRSKMSRRDGGTGPAPGEGHDPHEAFSRVLPFAFVSSLDHEFTRRYILGKTRATAIS
jgi:hypothetical protein